MSKPDEKDTIGPTMMSGPTITNICDMARGAAHAFENDESKLEALTMVCYEIVDQVDQGNLTWKTDEAAAMLHALLALSMDRIIVGGLLANIREHTTTLQ